MRKAQPRHVIAKLASRETRLLTLVSSAAATSTLQELNCLIHIPEQLPFGRAGWKHTHPTPSQSIEYLPKAITTMPSKLKDEDIEVDEAPTTIDPYAVLAIQYDATEDQIKSAYRKAALKHHPDKAAPSDREAAHTKFQEVAFAYAILSDEKRRKRYDTTGNTSESLDLEDDDFDWTTFYREQFQSLVTEETINNFAQGYKGSDEERGLSLIHI